MSGFPLPEYRVSTDRLRIGVYIRLEGLKWHEHPFLFRNFKLSNNNQIQTLRAMGIKDVICVPAQSDILPLNETSPAAVQDNAIEGKSGEYDTAQDKTALDDLWLVKHERAERFKLRQEMISKREKSYIATQERVSRIINSIAAADLGSLGEVEEFADSFSAHFLEDAESTLHLMGFAANEETSYYHAMNVAVLSMMLAREVGTEAEEMKILCQGALLHDIGKNHPELKVLLEERKLTGAQMELMKRHPEYGVAMLSSSTTFPRLALRIVKEHHEFSDGSGYPEGIYGRQIHLLSKIVSIANVYDKHCNKPNSDDSLTPYEALSYMFLRQKAVLDENLASSFIHCLGIYPPGTIVQLSNDAIGLVIASNPENRLHP
ncbi:MAG: DUF3391 domain-containing protein, partial [Smithellaceae bacterium]|nr:DUF3391 domain-containing protein [Smithellaceae bacterium]